MAKKIKVKLNKKMNFVNELYLGGVLWKREDLDKFEFFAEIEEDKFKEIERNYEHENFEVIEELKKEEKKTSKRGRKKKEE